jgi:hypothetical protein
MCRQVTCKQCQKPTWAGCGAHVEQVLAHVPVADRCQGHAIDKRSASGRSLTLGRLFRRER